MSPTGHSPQDEVDARTRGAARGSRRAKNSTSASLLLLPRQVVALSSCGRRWADEEQPVTDAAGHLNLGWRQNTDYQTTHGGGPPYMRRAPAGRLTGLGGLVGECATASSGLRRGTRRRPATGQRRGGCHGCLTPPRRFPSPGVRWPCPAQPVTSDSRSWPCSMRLSWSRTWYPELVVRVVCFRRCRCGLGLCAGLDDEGDHRVRRCK